MTRKILCQKCHKDIQESAEKYNQVYEYAEGYAKRPQLACDDCGQDFEDNPCYIGVLVNSRNDPAYEKDKPIRWSRFYVVS